MGSFIQRALVVAHAEARPDKDPFAVTFGTDELIAFSKSRLGPLRLRGNRAERQEQHRCVSQFHLGTTIMKEWAFGKWGPRKRHSRGVGETVPRKPGTGEHHRAPGDE